jgi:hypothetical protein
VLGSDISRGSRTHRLDVLLDEEHAARLRGMADQSHAAEGTLARSLLSRASPTAFRPTRKSVSAARSCLSRRFRASAAMSSAS